MNPTCPAGSCKFVEKFISAYLCQIALEIMLLPILNAFTHEIKRWLGFLRKSLKKLRYPQIFYGQ